MDIDVELLQIEVEQQNITPPSLNEAAAFVLEAPIDGGEPTIFSPNFDLLDEAYVEVLLAQAYPEDTQNNSKVSIPSIDKYIYGEGDPDPDEEPLDEVISNGVINQWLTTDWSLIIDAPDGLGRGTNGGGTGGTSPDPLPEPESCGQTILAPDGAEYNLPPGFSLVEGGSGENAGHHYMRGPNGEVYLTPWYAGVAAQNYSTLMATNAELSAFFQFGGLIAFGSLNYVPLAPSVHNATLIGLFLAIPSTVVALLGLTPPPPGSPSSSTDGACNSGGG